MKVEICQEVIKSLRASKGWTQEKLAEVSGVHTRTIQRIENDGIASLQSLNGLASALDVEPASLLAIEPQLEALCETFCDLPTETYSESSTGPSVQTTNQPALHTNPIRTNPLHTKNSHRSIGLAIDYYREKRHFKKYMQDDEKERDWLLNEWAAWAVLLMGGFLTVNVLLLTQANLSSPIVFKVFFPGTAIGLLLILAGGVGIHLSKEAREHNSQLSSKWISWIFLLSGCFFALNGLFLTQTDLNRPALVSVLSIGLLLLLIGSIGLLLSSSQNLREQNTVS